jgi:hypothetical protein
VDKDVLSTVGLLNEAEAFGIIEPLDTPSGHRALPPAMV